MPGCLEAVLIFVERIHVVAYAVGRIFGIVKAS